MTEETKLWVVAVDSWAVDCIESGDLSEFVPYASLEVAEKAAKERMTGSAEVYEVSIKLKSVVRTVTTTEVERL